MKCYNKIIIIKQIIIIVHISVMLIIDYIIKWIYWADQRNRKIWQL